MVHLRCFTCSVCKCELDTASYGCDLNGNFFCPVHMKSAQPSEQDYRVLAKGYLRKQGNIVKKWRRRYFYLEVDSCEIRYYKHKNLVDYCGAIDLSAVSNVLCTYLTVPPDKSNAHLPSGSLPSIQLVTPGRVWNLACDTDSIRETWREAISQARAMLNPASPAASCGVGRHGLQSISSPTVRSPKPEKSSLSSSPLPTSLSQPYLLSPLRSQMPPPIVQRPSSTTPAKIVNSEMSPSCFTIISRQSSEGDETVSPEDTSQNRSRRESGLGRGDGSAKASQYVTTTTGSSIDAGAIRSKVSPPPIQVPVSGFMSGNSTPMTGSTTTTTGAQFMSPVSPGKKYPPNDLSSSEIVSPVPWQPSTPRNISGKGLNSSCVLPIHYLASSRQRAASAGASLSPQSAQLSAPNTVAQTTVKVPGVPSEDPAEDEGEEESLLCSPHVGLIAVCVDSKNDTFTPMIEVSS